jgi:hypothetical protein
MASTLKLNYGDKALANVINYDHKCDAIIWRVNLMLSFTILICFLTGHWSSIFSLV